MKTSNNKPNEKMQKIADKARDFYYNRISNTESWRILNMNKMVQYRNQFEKEAEKIGFDGTFGDMLA